MHIYPTDYESGLVTKWIKYAIDNNVFSIDIRFKVPVEMHNINTKYIIKTNISNKILGEISQRILRNKRVDGSITFGGTTATVDITLV